MAEGSYDSLWDVAWDAAARSGPGFRSRYDMLLRLMAEHGVSGRLLEVGAGRGYFLEALHRRFPWLELTAHENAEGALAHLRSLSFLKAVTEGELAPNGGLGHAGFHTIVCSEVLEHIASDGAALDAMAAILRPGGRLFLTVPLRADLWTRVDDAVGHERRYERGQLASMCRDRGLVVDTDSAFGFPFYNAYYRLLGRRTPAESAGALRSPLAQLGARGLTVLFGFESRFDTPWGGRGVVVARRPLDPKERGR